MFLQITGSYSFSFRSVDVGCGLVFSISPDFEVYDLNSLIDLRKVVSVLAFPCSIDGSNGFHTLCESGLKLEVWAPTNLGLNKYL